MTKYVRLEVSNRLLCCVLKNAVVCYTCYGVSEQVRTSMMCFAHLSQGFTVTIYNLVFFFQYTSDVATLTSLDKTIIQ